MVQYFFVVNGTYRLQPERGFSAKSFWLTPIKPIVANIQAIVSKTIIAIILTGRTTIVKNAVWNQNKTELLDMKYINNTVSACIRPIVKFEYKLTHAHFSNYGLQESTSVFKNNV